MTDGQLPLSSFVKSCKVRDQDTACSAHTVITGFGACYTLLDEPEPALIVDKTGDLGSYNLEVDIAQHEYSTDSSTKGAGIRVIELCNF